MTAAPYAPHASYAPYATPPFGVDERRAALLALGASGAAAETLLAYAASPFAPASLDALPLADEPFVATWRAYADEARAASAASAAPGAGGAVATLRRHLVQLRFPIAAGVCDGEDYRAATRRGLVDRAPGPDLWPAFVDPDGVRLFVHETPAGAVPVVTAAARADFETLVRALSRRNAPDVIAPAQGACIVAGYNNWERVADERRRWAAARRASGDDAGDGGDEAAWLEAFAEIRTDPSRYQDRFVILSAGPYSAVRAESLGMRDDEWRARSLTIRLEHECAHYFTKRLLGSMRNALHDELLADYAGIVSAAGRYRADWGLRFFGVAADGTVAPAGRLHTYRGAPPLDDAAFAVLARVAVRAVGALAAFDDAVAEEAARDGAVRPPLVAALGAIARLSLEELTAPDAADRLRAAHDDACRELGVH